VRLEAPVLRREELTRRLMYRGGKEIAEILATEWSPAFWDDVARNNPVAAHRRAKRFTRLCQDAMTVSYFKYGLVAEGCGPGKFAVPMESTERRLRLYEAGGQYVRDDPSKVCRPGNTEWLTDVANYAMMESMHPRLPLTVGRGEKRGARDEPPHHRVEQVRTHVKRFDHDRNYWHLVSIARLAMAEFVTPNHPGAHFKATDGSPGRETAEGETDRANVASRVREFTQ
jgi:hypothetical protein